MANFMARYRGGDGHYADVECAYRELERYLVLSFNIGIHRRVSSASYFVKRSAKLFDERTSRCQIGKAPPRICLIVPNNSATMSRLKASRFMKTYDLPV
jgi:hypothetical protein